MVPGSGTTKSSFSHLELETNQLADHVYCLRQLPYYKPLSWQRVMQEKRCELWSHAIPLILVMQVCQ